MFRRGPVGEGPRENRRRSGPAVLHLLLGGLLVTSVSSGPAAGFHSRGVGHCGGCHAVHVVDGVPIPSSDLLGGASATDVCLNCHATASGNSWGMSPQVPGPVYGGGQFAFLDEDNLNDGSGGNLPQNWIPGSAAGHSVVAVDRGTVADAAHPLSPGGTYPSNSLGCTSCHDPHGKGGTYRLLYGDDSPASSSNGYTFRFRTPAPDATGIDVSGPPESNAYHNAYRAGMSAWCGNCHGRYHSEQSLSAFKHPVDVVLELEIVNRYNRYDGTGQPDGQPAQSYLAAVPYEASDMTPTSTGPAPSTARLSCLSCHRAHASSSPSAGRWDFKIETWAQEGGASGSYRIPNPYGSTAGDRQRPLCAKCHGD